jgi:hypothetical protein
MSVAKDQPGIRACRQKLPPEQAQHLQTEIMNVMSGGMGGAGPMHGAPPADPGSGAAPMIRGTVAGSNAGSGSGSGSSAP